MGTSLSPCGESGLKYELKDNTSIMPIVSPHAGRVD